jgi:hypothetical protein
MDEIDSGSNDMVRVDMADNKGGLMARKQTFKEWLKQQRKRQDAVGDLARDVQQDSGLPRGNAGIEDWRIHLEDRGACYDAMQNIGRSVGRVCTRSCIQ